ncbi:MAG: DNA cytosine methyltransferase [Nitrosomonas sp.]|uniref:DNA cytosine methyltransferase n=1 Tax=Nitrosomonas sp. TaxID=42353 RepID=UPI0025E4609E|nr:DNA cytosine methyltransferase [Nitrosomonas sp.]MBY0473678.1 DNA cytosine methyltransferase [Nitrosomonas sp.]
MADIKVVDLFAGPGGLGEGFFSFSNKQGRHPFRTVISVEKETSAHKTLTLRSFVRRLLKNGDSLTEYFAYLRGERSIPYSNQTKAAWVDATAETLQVTLGTVSGDKLVMERVKKSLRNSKNWILIGGPPCQAYSVIGRSRNKGIRDYTPEADHRHFLYRAYLTLLAELQPPVFLLENVKGILTSRVYGDLIFPNILRDLSDPAGKTGKSGPKYRIHSISSDEYFEHGHEHDLYYTSKYVVKAENHGLPQNRHRVILIGVREDIDKKPRTLDYAVAPTVAEIIKDMPFLRSGITTNDGSLEWMVTVNQYAEDLRNSLKEVDSNLSDKFAEISSFFNNTSANILSRGGRFISHPRTAAGSIDSWIGSNAPTDGFANHESRCHMHRDLLRYLFASSYALVKGRSPIAIDFPENLAPLHKSWSSGEFDDRFRVQLWNHPSTTITSHMSKDGHYFIHPDPRQCRSLTVREAARLQTFPDNYFFEGNRTPQYVQVGNAVPPLLGHMIARRIYELIS